MAALEYYATRHPHFTREQWRDLIIAGQITCQGRALAPDEALNAFQVLHYFRAPWEEPDVSREIAILYSDEQLIVFDKPDGMPVLPGGYYLEHSMVMLVRRRLDRNLSPLHRLGRGTSGAILFTRTREAATVFSSMMRRRQIGKTYLALVRGIPARRSFSIDTPIGRVGHPRLGDIHDVTKSGKEAVSECAVLAAHRETDTSLVQVCIPTGRTHQIRIHLASVGHPLVGDKFYRGRLAPRPGEEEASGAALPGDPGYILHSWKLRYSDPMTGTDREIIAPARQEIISWCDRAGAELFSA